MNNLRARSPYADLAEFDDNPWIVNLATKEIHELSFRCYYPVVSPDGRYLCSWNNGRLELWRITHV